MWTRNLSSYSRKCNFPYRYCFLAPLLFPKIVSLAGKYTIDESKAYGTPGIFIPIKNHFEQEDNAKEEGFSYEDVNRLDSLINKKLEEKRNPHNYDGAKKAANIIKKFL